MIVQSLVAGIDPSLTNTAVVIGGGSKYECKTFSSQPSGKDVASRIHRVSALVDGIVEFVRDNAVEVVCLEGYSYGSNMPGHHTIVEYGGLLRYKLLPHCAIYEVAPTTLKKFATGKGSGKKIGMVSCLARRYGVDFRSDDEYDAFGLYLLAMGVAGSAEPENQAQAQAIRTVVEARNGKNQ